MNIPFGIKPFFNDFIIYSFFVILYLFFKIIKVNSQ